jgi:hypothetical protein
MIKLRNILNEINVEKPHAPLDTRRFVSLYKQKLEQFIKDPENRRRLSDAPDYGITKDFTNDRPQYIGDDMAVLWKEPWHEEIAHGFVFKLMDRRDFEKGKIGGQIYLKTPNPEWEDIGFFTGRTHKFEGNYIYIAYVSVDPSVKKV